MNHLDRARAHFSESANINQRAADECMASILAAADLLGNTFKSGAKVMLCGNGGSAADCQHFATELVSRYSNDIKRPGLPAIALTTDTSFLTAYSNDCGFEGVFERQVLALGKPGDVLIGISTSGNSTNVIRALIAAKEADMQTLVLTGRVGRLGGMADIAISVPSEHTQHIQEAHIVIEHILCDLVENHLFRGQHQAGETAHDH